MCQCVEIFRLTPLKHSHKLSNIICFSKALNHNKSSSINCITVMRIVFKFTLKIIKHPVLCTYNIYNVTCPLR